MDSKPKVDKGAPSRTMRSDPDVINGSVGMKTIWMFLSLLSLVFGGVACDSGGDDDEPAENESPGNTEEQIHEVEFQLNEAISLEYDFTVTVAEANAQPTAGALVAGTEVYLSRPAEGNTFVVVQMDFTNGGTEEHFGPGHCVLRGPDGTEYEFDGSATSNFVVQELYADQDTPRGDYAPEETRREAKVFEVSETAWAEGGFELVFTVDPWGDAAAGTTINRVHLNE